VLGSFFKFTLVVGFALYFRESEQNISSTRFGRLITERSTIPLLRCIVAMVIGTQLFLAGIFGEIYGTGPEE